MHNKTLDAWFKTFVTIFWLVMAIGIYALFTYKVDAPEPKPGGGGGHGMILPQDGEYAPHARIWPRA